MKTRLLKKLRKEFDKYFKIVYINGNYQLCAYNKYYKRWNNWYLQSEKYSLKQAKSALEECWRVYALDRVGHIKRQKRKVKL